MKEEDTRAIRMYILTRRTLHFKVLITGTRYLFIYLFFQTGKLAISRSYYSYFINVFSLLFSLKDLPEKIQL